MEANIERQDVPGKVRAQLIGDQPGKISSSPRNEDRHELASHPHGDIEAGDDEQPPGGRTIGRSIDEAADQNRAE